MAESSTKKKDMISEMPRDMQVAVLGFLPLRDAVRTSILSRQWRHSWTMIPHLIFDEKFLKSIRSQLDQCGRNPELKALKFVSVINKIVLLHNGPILKFFLEILDGCSTRTIHDHIARWIPLFLRKGVKQLTLRNPYRDESIGHDFSSLDLTDLKLTRVRLPSTQEFGEFTYLTNLELFDAINFGQNILNCPVLETLKLIYCVGLSPTNFHAPKLKCVYEISAQITLSGLRNITEYSFGLCSYSYTKRNASNLVEVLGSLHKIEKFSIGGFFIRYLAEGGCPDRLSKPMPYLNTLNIFEVNFSVLSEVSCLLCLIRSAPNLRKLHISADHSNYDTAVTNLMNYLVDDSEAGTNDRLEIVIFSFLEGRRVELELVKFILAHSPLLKTMFIHYSGIIKKDAAVMTEEILQYSRASSNVQIRHSEERPVTFIGHGSLGKSFMSEPWSYW